MTKKKPLLATFFVLLVGLAVVYFLFPSVPLTLATQAERRAANFEQREVDIAGHHIAYLIGGQGDVLVLLHGFGADKDNWSRVARDLTPHFQVIAPDLPGFGDSSREPKASYAFDDQVDNVHAFVQALNLNTFHIGGNSMGGAIAGLYAARHPDMVTSVWLLAPAGVDSAEPSELMGLLRQGHNPLLVHTVADFERLLEFVFVEIPSIPGPIVGYLTEQAIAQRPFNEKIFQDFIAHPASLESEAQNIQSPTLITWGDQDRLLHVSGAAILDALIPDSHLVIMKNIGHIPMIERPHESARQFLRFRGLVPE